MEINRFSDDRIQQMIKRKITITNGITFNKNKAYSSNQYRNKTSQKLRKPLPTKNKNDIVIMNMPPSNFIDFTQNDSDPFVKKFTTQKQHQKRVPFFTNPQILSQIEKFQSYMFCESSLNKQNCNYNNSNNGMQLKKYSSVNIRFTYDGKSKGFSQGYQNSSSRLKGIGNDNINQYHKSSSVPLIQFKPSFRELLKRNTKASSKIETKLKKSQFNYQRAISTSCQSRKKAFMKILNAFEENCAKKINYNPEILLSKPQEQANRLRSKEKVSPQLISRVRTCRKSPQIKERKQKDEEGCRPWSAGKRNQIKLQPTEDENPLQFYSINAKY